MSLQTSLKSILSNPVYVHGAIFSVSIGALTFALIMQFVFNLAPCDLCIWQRIPFVITALLGLAGLIAGLNPEWLKASSLMAFIAGLIFFAGSIIAFYHHGVEQHWWRSFLQGCKIILPESSSDIYDFIKNAKAVPCDAIPWSFLGLSMAAWNIFLSLGLSIFSILASIALVRRANNFL
jgi:disulfide bond formation protein DsbB